MRNNCKLLSAPQIDYYIDVLRGGERGIDADSLALVDVLFTLLKTVRPCGDDERRELWLTAERGALEDFHDYSELTEEENRSEYKQWRFEAYPDEIVWFSLLTVEHDGYRGIAVGQKIVVQIDPRMPNAGALTITPFLQWIIATVKVCIEKLRDGSYNEYVKQNLPYRHRVSTVLRRYYWDVIPEAKTSNLKGISQDEIDEFTALIADQDKDEYPNDRIHDMTAERFYECCALGYLANAYDGTNTLSPKELYSKHADGRDEGLCAVDNNSPEAFHEWLHDRKHSGGHPWEVCRGGNSTHISLYVHEDERGYCLTLAGSAWNRTVETIKFYLALVNAHIPVRLMDGHILAERMLGTEKIGIVPHGVIPAYCSGYFPNENIIDYMNLPLEYENQLGDYAVWQDIPKRFLCSCTAERAAK